MSTDSLANKLSSDRFSLMIPNAPAPAGTLIVTAPFDGAQIAEVEQGGETHVERAMETAFSLYRNRSAWLELDERIAILERCAELMVTHQELLSSGAAQEGGKPLIDSNVEITRAIDGVRLCIDVLKNDHGEVIPMGMSKSSKHRIAFTQKEPIGVVVAVSAFNHPLNLIVHQVAAAIASGCPTVVKPADDTPLSCLRFVKILHAAGLPPAWCQVLIAKDIATSEKLVSDARVGFFSFIGSAKVGWMLRSKLAPGARCALEHGGAAPLIVAQDADLDRAVGVISKGGFYHAGQVCVSVQRVFAHQSIAPQLTERLSAAASDLIVGDPLDAKTEVGPLIRHPEVARVGSWVNEAISEGATVMSGGHAISDSCYECTVLHNPASDSKVSQQEIFGPVVCIYDYKNIEQAIASANSLPFSFQSAIFTSNLDTAMMAFKKLDASAVMINDHTAFRIDGMPFAGLKQSGLGVGGIPHTMKDMMIEKMLVINSSYV